MSRFYQCDQCEAEQGTPMVYELTQITDDTDEDGDYVIAIFHLCSSKCLCDFAMTLSLDFPDVDPIGADDAETA